MKSVMCEPFYDVCLLGSSETVRSPISAATSLRVLLSAAHPLSAAAKATLYFSLKLKLLHFFNERIITRSTRDIFPAPLSASSGAATRCCPHQSIIWISAASSLLQNPTFVLLRAQGLRTASQQLFVFLGFFNSTLCKHSQQPSSLH